MIPEELSEFNGWRQVMGSWWRLIPEDARITRIKYIKEIWLELFEVLMYLSILDNSLNNYNSFLTNFANWRFKSCK